VNPGQVRVSGGTDSISADFAHLAELARSLDRVAGVGGAVLPAAASALADPALISAAVLDPIGAGEVVATAGVAIAVTTTLIAECEVLATALRAAVIGYREADDLRGRLAPTISALTHLQGALTAGTAQVAAGLHEHSVHKMFGGLLTIAEQDPALAGLIIDGVTGGLGLLPGGLGVMPGGLAGGRARSSTVNLAKGLGRLYPDGSPTLTARPGDPTLDSAGPPRSIADLIKGVDLRDANTDGGGIDVRFVSTQRPDGTVTRAAIVDITGTKDWGFTKFDNPNVSNLGTNLRGVGNEVTSYELGVLMAMQHSGIRPGEPIMLAGHSQGGVVAAQLASHLAGSSTFNVTHLVTAGSPIGLVDMPSSVSVLSLENAGDVVPELDGVSNPARPNWTTVTVDRGGAGFGPRHNLGSGYLPGAQDADAGNDPSVHGWVRGAGAFLQGQDVNTASYQVGRHG
jgi:hypothetical protein